jgi:hypothetical protein
LIRFFVTLTAVAIALAVSVYTMADRGWISALPSYFIQTLLLLLFGTGVLFVYLYKFDKAGFFVHLYLLTMMLKLIAYGAYNFFVIRTDQAGAVANVIWFMLLYLTFTVLEVVFLHHKVSK